MSYQELLERALRVNHPRFTGTISSPEDCVRVLAALRPCDAAWAIEPMSRYALANTFFVGPPDTRGDAVELRWMTPHQIIGEATEAFPGIQALPMGFFPFAGDATGSGDQFFLRCGSMNDRRVFRIYHDWVDFERNTIIEQGIKVILSDLIELFPYACQPY